MSAPLLQRQSLLQPIAPQVQRPLLSTPPVQATPMKTSMFSTRDLLFIAMSILPILVAIMVLNRSNLAGSLFPLGKIVVIYGILFSALYIHHSLFLKKFIPKISVFILCGAAIASLCAASVYSENEVDKNMSTNTHMIMYSMMAVVVMIFGIGMHYTYSSVLLKTSSSMNTKLLLIGGMYALIFTSIILAKYAHTNESLATVMKKFFTD